MGHGESERDVPRRVLELAERELHRVLLDIHDGPVQYMYAALSQLDLLRRSLAEAHAPPPPDALDRAERVRRILESGLGEMRSLIGAMRPPAFESRDLRELLEGLALQHETTTDTQVVVTFDGATPDAALPIKIAVYRVTQEALSNAYRHGGARHVAVHVSADARAGAAAWLRVTIRDDGSGFDPAQAVSADHLGLAGMRDRAVMLGGTLAVDSRPGAGAALTVELPAS